MRGIRSGATVASLLVWVLALPAMASDATAESVPGAERVEVPEAGLALTFPPDWNVDIEMREREDWGLSERYEDAAPLIYWSVLYASLGGRPWCDLTWYPEHPMTLDEHATEFELLVTPTHSDVERTAEMEPAALPAGESFRFVIHNGPTDDYSTVYLLDSEAGRFFLQCLSDERAGDDWLGVAQSLEWLPDTSPEP